MRRATLVEATATDLLTERGAELVEIKNSYTEARYQFEHDSKPYMLRIVYKTHVNSPFKLSEGLFSLSLASVHNKDHPDGIKPCEPKIRFMVNLLETHWDQLDSRLIEALDDWERYAIQVLQ